VKFKDESGATSISQVTGPQSRKDLARLAAMAGPQYRSGTVQCAGCEGTAMLVQFDAHEAIVKCSCHRCGKTTIVVWIAEDPPEGK
jgi:hypothetical protein